MKKISLKKSLSAVAVLLLSLAGSVYSQDHHGHQDADKESSEPAKGAHGGRLLQDGDFTLELAIYERGLPPEYRAWASYNGKPLSPKDWRLSVEITRLGGRVDKFSFLPQNDFLRGQGEVDEPHSFDVSVVASYNKQRYQWRFPSYEGRVQLSAEFARQAGITTALASPGTLQQQLKLYGQVQADPAQVRRLRARFPGVIRELKVSVGDSVSAGEILVKVEANESLRSYNISSPISGLVIERRGSEGEMTGEEALLTIADYSQLSISLPVFAQHAGRVQAGQKLQIKSAQGVSDTSILALAPAADGSPSFTARAALDNAQGQWTPGTWVDAAITLAEIPVALRVDKRALQAFRDWQVVFIQVGDNFEIRPLELGRSDDQFTEVLSGLNAGDRYVVDNSYLLKADLEKSGASHDH